MELDEDLEVRGIAFYRKTDWLGEVDRDVLSVRTKNSLGSTLTLFRLPEFAAADMLAALSGAPAPSETKSEERREEEEAEEPGRTFQEMELRATELIKDLITKLDWDEMQELIAGLLRAMGYKTRVAKPGPDRGTDIVASPDGLGFVSPRIVDGRHKDDRGLYVSTGGFSKDARYEADRASIPVTLWELDEVAKTVVTYYKQLDSDTRQLVPLRRIYWPAERSS